MNQEIPHCRLAIEETCPELFEEWKRRAATSLAWSDYMLLMNTFAEALRRAPWTVDECEKIDVVAALNTELVYLSDVLKSLYPDGVLRVRSYAPDTPPNEEQMPHMSKPGTCGECLPLRKNPTEDDGSKNGQNNERDDQVERPGVI